MNSKIIGVTALLFAGLSLAALAFAGVPQTINYQGYLKNRDGTPVTAATSMTFSLYSSISGTGAVWNSNQGGLPGGARVSVTPVNGIYTVQLGASPQPSLPPFSRQYWLGVKAGDDPEMVPLQALTSAPYALRSAVADNINISLGQYKYTVSGIATTSYNSALRCSCDESGDAADCPSTHYSSVDRGALCYDVFLSGGYDDPDLGWIDEHSGVPYARSSFSPLMTTGAYGGIGINTGTPLYDLDVSGTVRGTKFIGDGSALTSINASSVTGSISGNAANVTGTVGTAHGGTGISTSPSAAGRYLRSTGAGTWGINTIQAADLPGVYVDLTTVQTIQGAKSFSDQVTLGNGVKFPDNTIQKSAKTDCMGRYEDNGDGTVTDCRTGLIWLKNAGCSGAKYWQDAKTWVAALKNNSCGLTDGSDTGDWRLPTKTELMAMVASGKKQGFTNPVVTNSAGTSKWTEGNPFTNVMNRPYWSSSPHAVATNNAWRVRMGDGIADYEVFNVDFVYAWPVRSGQ